MHLVDGSASPFTVSACDANLPSARISTTTYAGEATGTPAEDWWDGCMWKTENVDISNNVIDFNPANVTDCNQTDWPDWEPAACSANTVRRPTTGQAGLCQLISHSFSTAPGRTTPTMAHQLSLRGIRAQKTIRLPGQTGPEACRAATNAKRPASSRADHASARLAKMLEVLTTAHLSLRTRSQQF